MSLYPHQTKSVEFHLTHHYSINASEMGLGKTRIALETAVAAGVDRLAVFGPAFLSRVWYAEAEPYPISVTYFPYSMIHKFSARDLAGFRFWVAEESHALKNPTAKRTNAFYQLLKTCVPDRLLMLSGTPIKNRIPDIWTTLGFCGVNPHKTSGKLLTPPLNKWRAFCRYFCEVDIRSAGGRSFEKYLALKRDKVDEFKSYLKDKMIRFEAAQVLKDLPKIVDTVFPVELAEVAGLETEFQNYMEGRKVDATAKALSALLKAPHTAEYVNLILESGNGPVVVFSDHIAPVELISAKIRGSKIITGQTPVPIRQKYVEDFQAGKIPTLVATIQSLGVGVTLTAASNVVFNDLSWTPADNEQARKRIHRIGQTRVCISHYVDGSDTDTYIRRTLREKSRATEEALS